jgi:ribulose-5-phosphate 4-epimerase/fuculose-1-phosphate aldolase
MVSMNFRLPICAGLLVSLVSAQAPAPAAKAAPGQFSVIDELVTANHILANEDVLDGYGHVSVRSPGNPRHYFLAGAGAPGLVTAADITEYDLDSTAVSNTARTGYIERFIHGEIYKARPEVMAVVHCHCAEVIPFADTGVPLQPMHHMGFFIGQGVPVFDIKKAAGETDILIRSPALGKALAQTLGGRTAVLMRGHGAAVAATSLHLVVGMSYYLNLNARLQYQAMLLGDRKVTYLDAEESRMAAQDYERSWDYWKYKVSRR